MQQAVSSQFNKHIDDGISPQNSYNPDMILVTMPLDGSNYLIWSRAMIILSSAKDKLEFINKKCEIHDLESDRYEKWLKANGMVTFWILNSISKDLVEAFLYATSGKVFWEEIKERFRESNGPLLYQLTKGDKYLYPK